MLIVIDTEGDLIWFCTDMLRKRKSVIVELLSHI